MMRVFDRLTRGVASLCVCVGGRECPIKYTNNMVFDLPGV